MQSLSHVPSAPNGFALVGLAVRQYPGCPRKENGVKPYFAGSDVTLK